MFESHTPCIISYSFQGSIPLQPYLPAVYASQQPLLTATQDSLLPVGQTFADWIRPCQVNCPLPGAQHKPIGLWGQRHKRYLQEHKRAVYISLLTSGKLNSYLADINEQAENILCRLVKKMAAKENVTEQLKAENQMLWVQLMNNIHNRAMEVVNSEIIYQ